MKLTDLQEQVLNRLKASPEEWLRASDISKTVKADPRSIGCALTGLFKSKAVTRATKSGTTIWRLNEGRISVQTEEKD